MAEGSEDTQLLTRYATGDVAAFETLYGRHRGPLYRYFLRQCGDPEVAAALFQEVWVRVIKARDRHDAGAPFTTYLYQIGHDCLVEHYRQSGQPLSAGDGEPETGEIPDLLAEELDPAFASARWSLVDWEQDTGDPASGPETANSAAQRAARVWSALEGLPPEQREAFLLHEEGGMGPAEIAQVTGASPETVKSRLGYAVQKLRGALGDLVPAGSREAGQ